MDTMEMVREYNQYMRDNDTAQDEQERDIENMKKCASMAIVWGE